jgi:uncharacterized membrane protein
MARRKEKYELTASRRRQLLDEKRQWERIVDAVAQVLEASG